jgi:hypothetical protein
MEDELICLVSAGASVATMGAERTHSYELHLYELGLHPDLNMSGDVLMATWLEPSVLEPYRAYAQFLLEADEESTPSHGLQDLLIGLPDSKQPPWGPIYYLSKMELNTLHSYF